MRVDAHHCAVCGQPRREANHWFNAALRVNGTLVISAFDPDSEAADICGEGCLHKWIATHLESVRPAPARVEEEL